MAMSGNNLFDEKKILLELSMGSEEAFEKIYNLHSHRIYCKLRRLLKSEVIAEEILQDVFLIIWNNRNKLNLEKSFCSFLFCIATNKCYDYFRRIKRDKKLLRELNVLSIHSNYSNTIEQGITDKGSSEMLHNAIELLPPKRKLIFRLCKVERKTYAEISAQLDISLSTISDHIVKANHFLKSQLDIGIL
jgi:RNA polymerase sigma-70 factor (ECF subfamily)